MAAVRAFVRANGFDRTVIEPPRARIGIMTTGKAYLDTRQALEDLGLSEERCKTLGIRLYKVGVTWPLEPEGARALRRGPAGSDRHRGEALQSSRTSSSASSTTRRPTAGRW